MAVKESLAGQQAAQLDKYLLHLAGQEGGESPIGGIETAQALFAGKNRCIRKTNDVCSFISGGVDGLFLSAAGLLTVPFFDQGIRNSIIGTAQDVCSSEALRRAVSRVEDPRTVDWITKNYNDNCWKPESLTAFRLQNWVTGLTEIVRQYPILTLGGILTVIGLSVAYETSAWKKSQATVKRELAKTLTGRYQNAADRLSKLKAIPEERSRLTQLAQGISARRAEIEREVKDLGVLRSRITRSMVQPVIDEASKILSVPENQETKAN